MTDHQTRVIRAVSESLPNPDRFSRKEWYHFSVIVLYPEDVKRQLGTAAAAKARALEIARKMISDRLYKPPELDPLGVLVEVVMLDLRKLSYAHRALEDRTKVWLAEAERSANGVPWPPL